MREFLKGWRRKAGCATLVIACVLMAGWMRNLNGHPEFIFRGANELPSVIKSKTHRFVIASTSRKLFLCLVRNQSGFDIVGPFYQSSVSVGSLFAPAPVTNLGSIHTTDVPIAWKFKCCGLELAKRANTNEFDLEPIEITSVVVPYLAVLPMTLLSAYLLLSKPRRLVRMRANQRPTTEAA